MKRGRSFLNERGQAGQYVGLSDAVIKILVHIHCKLVGGPNQRLKSILCADALGGACLQAHISFADALSGTQFGWMVV